jgi:hypothetical protein
MRANEVQILLQKQLGTAFATSHRSDAGGQNPPFSTTDSGKGPQLPGRG